MPDQTRKFKILDATFQCIKAGIGIDVVISDYGTCTPRDAAAILGFLGHDLRKKYKFGSNSIENGINIHDCAKIPGEPPMPRYESVVRRLEGYEQNIQNQSSLLDKRQEVSNEVEAKHAADQAAFADRLKQKNMPYITAAIAAIDNVEGVDTKISDKIKKAVTKALSQVQGQAKG